MLPVKFRKGTWSQRLRLRKYLKSGRFGSIHRKIPVDPGGTTAYFGKHSGPGLGSWHLCPGLDNVYPKSTPKKSGKPESRDKGQQYIG